MKVTDSVLKQTQSESFGGNYRSIDPEYFVFTSFEIRDKTYLQESRCWYPCGTIEYHPVEFELPEGKSLHGVIACLQENQKLGNQNYTHIYDVAGIPVNRHTAPLEVPYYELNHNGALVIGPRP